MVTVFAHIVAAIAWIGGMIFLVVVFVPVLRKTAEPASAIRLFHLLGRRFRTVGWVALGTLVVTGAMNVTYRGYGLLDWLTGNVFAGQWGRTLLHKLLLVGAILGLSVVHDFSLGPRALAAPEGTPARERLRKLASWFGRITFVLALAVVAFAVQLAR
jgi:uncharacterized membrane protein